MAKVRMMRPRVLRDAPLVAMAMALTLLLGACVRPAHLQGPTGWVNDDAVAGISVFHPDGWRLSSDARSGRIEITGPERARAIVWPFFAGGYLSSASWSAVVSALAKLALPTIHWGDPASSGSSTVRLTGSSPQARATAVLTWVGSSEGTAATLYVASSAPGSYPRLRTTFATIFRSFRIAGAMVTPLPGSGYVVWRDPTEGAFSMEIPKGWTASGGIVRPRGEPRFLYSEVKLLSPDGSIVIYMGDGFPSFSEPNATRRAGTTYQLDGHFYYVERYLPGAQFLLNFALPLVAPSFKVLSQQDRPDLAQDLLMHGVSRYDAGEVEYRFESNGQLFRGGSLCITEETAARAGTTDWSVWRLLLFQGPESRYGEGAAAAARLAATFRVDPGWIAANLDVLGQAGRNLAGNGQSVGSMVSRGPWAREGEDPMVLRRQVAIVTERAVVDPATGERFELDTSATYYWVDGLGMIAGTESEAVVGLNLESLL